MRGAALAWYNDLIARGKTEGIALGEARGEARGRALEKAQGIVTVLSRKFSRVPKTISQRLNQIQDLTVLDSLFISALDCASIEEFKSCLP